MQRDVVEDRRWISKKDYLEGSALAQFAPGPLAAHLGWVRFGLRSDAGHVRIRHAFVHDGGRPCMLVPAFWAVFHDAGRFLFSALVTAWTESEIHRLSGRRSSRCNSRVIPSTCTARLNRSSYLCIHFHSAHLFRCSIKTLPLSLFSATGFSVVYFHRHRSQLPLRSWSVFAPKFIIGEGVPFLQRCWSDKLHPRRMRHATPIQHCSTFLRCPTRSWQQTLPGDACQRPGSGRLTLDLAP
jgi:hypothetical protein